MEKRSFIAALGGMFAGTALPRISKAQSFPSNPIRVLSAFGAGSSADVIIRLAAPHLQQTLGQPIVVDGVAGAGGNIAALQVARAQPDGYTLLMAVNNMFGSNPFLIPTGNFDPTTAFAPIMPLANFGLVLVAGPAAPAQTVAAVLEVSRHRPVRYGTPGVGTPPHLIGELLRERTGSNLVHVPYKGGGQMATDILSGQVEIGISAYTPVAGFVQAGKLKPLAVCGPQRLGVLPHVPTLAETVADITLGAWGGLVAPKGTPKNICDTLASAMRKALAVPGVLAQMIELGLDPIPGGAETLMGMIAQEHEVAGSVLRRLKIKLN